MGVTVDASDVSLSLTPDVTKVSKSNRTITHEWVVGTVASERSETGSAQIVARLSVFHGHGYFAASFSAVVRYKESGFFTETWMPFSDGFTVGRKPVARYSLKALTEYSEVSLGSFTQHDEHLDRAAEILVRIINENGGL